MRSINRNRINFIFALLFLFFLILLARALYLNLALSGNENAKIKKLNPNRRYDILDRNDNILATDIVTYTLYAEPYNIRSVKQVVNDLKEFAPLINWQNIEKN